MRRRSPASLSRPCVKRSRRISCLRPHPMVRHDDYASRAARCYGFGVRPRRTLWMCLGSRPRCASCRGTARSGCRRFDWRHAFLQKAEEDNAGFREEKQNGSQTAGALHGMARARPRLATNGGGAAAGAQRGGSLPQASRPRARAGGAFGCDGAPQMMCTARALVVG